MKQKMFRRSSYMERKSVSTSRTDVVLFTAPEACTIRRLIGYISQKPDDSVNTITNFTLNIAPASQMIGGAVSTSGESLDKERPMEYLGGGIIETGATGSATDIRNPATLKWETQGMRKLRKNDELVISFTANNSNPSSLSAYFDIFISQ